MVAEAIRLMEKALNLFDNAGIGTAAFACHLSMAIDCAQAAFDADGVSMLRQFGDNEALPEGGSLH
ncbi:hypothetical protein Sj15T_10280 [Sphingobium sp. TA15]|nr:hypothetical protein Sj15T_10280 [Sphingobium sp. TA15]